MNTVKKKAKIIATIGPASRSKDMIWKLHKAGANIFRLNFSHGSHDDHLKVINWVKELNEEHGTNICLLQDLQGPKIRVNQIIGDAVEIKEGDLLKIVSGDFDGNAEKISTTYETIAKDVNVGDPILIDDGNLELVVVDTDGTTVTAKVVFGGMLKSRKGINLPETDISVPSLTAKDKEDLLFALDHDIDWVALSFVRTAQCIHDVKKIIASKGKDFKVIAKIEKPEAVKNMDEIIEATDAVMVARGDLGVEIDMARVPLIQKELVYKCNAANKPAIVATQMLESMVSNPRPTRAETNDVANAILDGADVVMLSAESAAGKYPIEAVQSMTRIITEIETNSDAVYHFEYEEVSDPSTALNEALVEAACQLAHKVEAKAIIGMTESGYTAFSIAKYRPKADIYVFTSNKKLVTRLNLIWGVTAFYHESEGTTNDVIDEVKQVLIDKGYLEKGDVIVNTASMPLWRKRKTNMCKVSIVE